MGENWRSRGTTWTKFVRSSVSQISVVKTTRWSFIGTWMGESTELGMYVRSSGTRLFLSVCGGWHQNGWKEAGYGSHVEAIDDKCGYWRTHIISWPCVLGMHSAWMQTEWNHFWRIWEDVWNTFFCGSSRKNYRDGKKPLAQTVPWSYDMEGHAQKCDDRCCELANKKVEQLYKVSSPCLDDHQFKEEEMKSVGELSKGCSQIVLKCWNLARIGRPDILCSVNKLARSITKWTKACDKRLNRLISKIHHTCEYKQYCHVGNTAKQCRLGLFQDSDFAGDLEDPKSTSGGTLCVFASHTFVPISWMCKKQTSVSHSSTESEIISLDTGLRLDGLPALELWDLIVSVLGNVSRVSDRSGKPESDDHKHHKSDNKIDVMIDIDVVLSNVQSARQEALLYVFEDNEAVIKMIIKGRSPTKRHVSRTHRVALDWLFDRINLDSKIQIKYIYTKNQLADILTKGNFHTWCMESFVDLV